MELSLQNITKSYGKNLALNGFSLRMTPGIYALLGPNGAGKSTLIHILTDNLKADSGTVTYTDRFGKTENTRAMGERFREKLGFMPQQPAIYNNFSAERFLWYVASLKGMSRTEAARRIPEVLSAVELSDVARHRIGTFSGGMKQRLSLAQAVLGDPSVLILDEPTAGLDPKQRIVIRNYISRIALNKIVIIATHIVSDIEYIARDVIMLKKGVILDHGTPSALASKIHGTVWSLHAKEAEIASLSEKFRIVSMVKNEASGGITLRILSKIKPCENAVLLEPSLEDYYLSVFGEN